MKLQSVKFDKNSDKWYSSEYLPDNLRDVLIYTPETGTSVGYYNQKWYSYKYLNLNITYWREMPRYELSDKNSL